MTATAPLLNGWMAGLIVSSIGSALLGNAFGADPPPKSPKLMFEAPRDWRLTPFSDSVVFYDSPALKKGEHCRISVFSRTEISTFENWFGRVQGKEPVIEQSKLLEGRTKRGYPTLRLSKLVKLPTSQQHQQYHALRSGQRFALILCTASNADLLKAAVQKADELVDNWDYSGEFPTARTVTIANGVVQVRLPAEDVTLFYVETEEGFRVKLEGKDGAIEGRKLYIGDGKVAADLIADPADGIFLQGVRYRQGDQFRKGSTIAVRPGYKLVSELKAGDVYVKLPGVTFTLPEK